MEAVSGARGRRWPAIVAIAPGLALLIAAFFVGPMPTEREARR